MNRKILLTNAAIFTPVDEGSPWRGDNVSVIELLDPGAMIISDGIIERIGEAAELEEESRMLEIGQVIDAGGKCVIPGFVDPHTHMCFAGDREEEFSMRLKGMSYMDIHKRGGGIMSTVRKVRDSSSDDIRNILRRELGLSLSYGVTSVEIKSGYGLNVDAETKMLDCIDVVSKEVPQDIVTSFMGAHSIPAEHRGDRESYIEILVKEMIPAVSGKARFCDIFTEEGVFTVDESERILSSARENGFALKAHVDEVVDMNGAAMAARMGCISAEHLLAANDEGLKNMAEAGTIAVLLPGTAFSLRKQYARGRDMIRMGVPVAIASDCNPGSCFTSSIPFIFSLAVMQMGLSIDEALTAATLNAAYAIGIADKAGSLTPGKQADFIILDGKTPACIPYRPGMNPVTSVYKKGERVAGKH